jgi:Bacterial regulatory proteins, tetR family
MVPTTRDALVAAAAQLLDAGGPEAVTLREVGHRAGVSHNAPYKRGDHDGRDSCPDRRMELNERGAGQAATRTEHFRIMSTLATSRKLSVIATGTFTAGGTDIPGRFTDKLVFPGGTFKIRYHFTTDKINFSPRTCLLTETQRGTYRLSHGTGRYTGIRGSGRAAAGLVGVFARNSKGECTHLAAPRTFQSVLTAGGPVRR